MQYGGHVGHTKLNYTLQKDTEQYNDELTAANCELDAIRYVKRWRFILYSIISDTLIIAHYLVQSIIELVFLDPIRRWQILHLHIMEEEQKL